MFVFLNYLDKVLDVSFRVKDCDSSYMIFASTESLRCFECGDYRHKRLSCPLEEPRISGETEETLVHKDVEVNLKNQARRKVLWLRRVRTMDWRGVTML